MEGEKQQTARYLGKALMAYEETGEADHGLGKALTAMARSQPTVVGQPITLRCQSAKREKVLGVGA
jgi:hypothetical protein